MTTIKHPKLPQQHKKKTKINKQQKEKVTKKKLTTKN
jgi:hypothetical protein